MMRQRVALIAALAVSGACHHGTQVDSLSTPKQPNGAQVILDLNSGTFSGELMAVEESGLVLLSGNRLVLVPFESIHTGRLPEFARAVSLGSGLPAPDALRKLRLLSHFPGGISPLIKSKLLSLYRQADWAAVQ
jgi:hypothetical protein